MVFLKNKNQSKIVIQVKIAPWDKIFEIDRITTKKEIQKDNFKVGDFVVARIDSHTDLGQIVNILEEKDSDGDKNKKEMRGFIFRRAIPADFEKIEKKKKEKGKILTTCRHLAEKHQLSIKIVDIHLSLEGGKIVVAFAAGQRVDFRELVKELSQEFHKSVRMHQINPRDEMFILGTRVGACGQPLCCSFLKKLGRVSTDLINEQQLIHRGAERLSGSCGRLKCCLTFESQLYRELIEKFPPVGSLVKVKNKKGVVVGWHTLKETVDLQFGKEKILEVPLNKIKKL